MAIRVTQIVKHNGVLYYPGDIIYNEDISKSETDRLVKKNLGESIILDEKEPEKSSEIDGQDEIGHSESLEDTLDLNFNTTELKDGAKDQNIEFKANIKKEDLIALLIEKNATDYFTEQLVD